MPELGVSIALQTDKSLANYGRIGKAVEELGFDRISVYNDLAYQPAWYPLMQIAQATDTINLGPAAVNPFTCHPINIAGNIDLLNQVAPGRVNLGMSRGAWLDKIGLQHSKPIRAMREAFNAINYLLEGNGDGLEGKFFPLAKGLRLQWQLSGKVSMQLGSWGPQTIRACAKYVEEVKVGGTANTLIVKRTRKILDELQDARQSSQHDTSKNIGLTIGAVCVVDQDANKAQDLAKQELALYLPVVSALDSTISISQEIIEQVQLGYQQKQPQVILDAFPETNLHL